MAKVTLRKVVDNSNMSEAVGLVDGIDARLSKAYAISCFVEQYKSHLDDEIPDCAVAGAMYAVREFIEEAQEMAHKLFEVASKTHNNPVG